MINISIRQKRLLKIWAKNFLIAIVSGIATFSFVSGLLISMIMLGKIYGPNAVLGTFVLCYVLSVCAALTYAYSKESLEKLEREEERTMNALKKDHNPWSKSLLDKQIKDSYKLILRKNGTQNNVFK